MEILFETLSYKYLLKYYFVCKILTFAIISSNIKETLIINRAIFSFDNILFSKNIFYRLISIMIAKLKV